MNIGEEERIIQVEPEPIVVPEELPAEEPVPDHG